MNLALTGETQMINAMTGDNPKPESPSTEEDDKGVGCVRWLGRGPLVLPPGTSCQVSCKVEFTQPAEKEILMLDALPTKPLPTGVLLTSIVVPRYAVDSNQFTIKLFNESRKEATISVEAILGHLYTTNVVITIPKSEHVSVELDANQIDFRDSPLPEMWKERLCKKLVERADVFSLHEWDVGLAKGVEHSIRLTDERPFHEQSRRLAPADIDDVRRHIQELIAAGIIKES